MADMLHVIHYFGGVENLKGKKIAAYYGCLLLRPGKTMQMDNPENPKILEDLSVQLVQHRYCIRCGTNAAAAI